MADRGGIEHGEDLVEPLAGGDRAIGFVVREDTTGFKHRKVRRGEYRGYACRLLATHRSRPDGPLECHEVTADGPDVGRPTVPCQYGHDESPSWVSEGIEQHSVGGGFVGRGIHWNGWAGDAKSRQSMPIDRPGPVIVILSVCLDCSLFTLPVSDCHSVLAPRTLRSELDVHGQLLERGDA